MSIIGQFVSIGNPRSLISTNKSNYMKEYDFRIISNPSENFYYLGLLNLALILAKQKNINTIKSSDKYYAINQELVYYSPSLSKLYKNPALDSEN